MTNSSDLVPGNLIEGIEKDNSLDSDDEDKKDREQNRKLRKEYIDKFYNLAVRFLISVGVAIAVNGAYRVCLLKKPPISNSVLITLLASSLTTIFAPTYMASKGLFDD